MPDKIVHDLSYLRRASQLDLQERSSGRTGFAWRPQLNKACNIPH